MTLTAEHQQGRTYSMAQVRHHAQTKTFEEIMALPMMERAEVLDYLLDMGATVKMKANQERDIPVRVADPTRREDPRWDEAVATEHVIPGGKQPAKSLPVRVAIHVYSCRDQPQFGGATYTGGEIKKDGSLSVINRVPERPGLISFELER